MRPYIVLNKPTAKTVGADIIRLLRKKAFPEGKACEARPVDDEANGVWRRGQNIQGVCRRIFWAPQEYRCQPQADG